jgi:thiol-disulfide isomerase/thioredoxin
MNTTRIALALGVASLLLATTLVLRSGGFLGPSTPDEHADLDIVLKDATGAEVSLASFAGKPLIINLWATWCGPCRLETPQLVKLYERYKEQGLVVVGISVDDAPDAVRGFADELKVTYPMFSGADVEERLHGLGYNDLLPMSILIRKDGTVAGRVTGVASTDAWERGIQTLLQ